MAKYKVIDNRTDSQGWGKLEAWGLQGLVSTDDVSQNIYFTD